MLKSGSPLLKWKPLWKLMIEQKRQEKFSKRLKRALSPKKQPLKRYEFTFFLSINQHLATPTNKWQRRDFSSWKLGSSSKKNTEQKRRQKIFKRKCQRRSLREGKSKQTTEYFFFLFLFFFFSFFSCFLIYVYVCVCFPSISDLRDLLWHFRSLTPLNKNQIIMIMIMIINRWMLDGKSTLIMFSPQTKRSSLISNFSLWHINGRGKNLKKRNETFHERRGG